MAEAILAYITSQTYWGIFVLMVLENVFPPIPSEVILPFVGHLSATGVLSLPLALFVATLGALVGTFFWFMIGWFIPVPTLEKFFHRFGGYVAISHKDFKAATAFFTRYEALAVFFGRLIPAVRSVISIPAGCVHMKVTTFIALSTLGATVWNTLLIGVSYYFLQDYSVIEKYISPVGNGIIGLFIVLYFVQVARFLSQRFRHKNEL